MTSVSCSEVRIRELLISSPCSEEAADTKSPRTIKNVNFKQTLSCPTVQPPRRVDCTSAQLLKFP